MEVARMTLSTFVQKPTHVLAKLDEGDVLLTRRDGEDVLLSIASVAESQSAAVSSVVELLATWAAAASVETLRSLISQKNPWAALLDAADRDDFVDEYLTTLRGCAAIGNFSRLAIVVDAWKGTAELQSDPALRARIRRRIASEKVIPARDPRNSSAH
ncbi:MAG: hypothetical protein PHU75_10580 [Candidatus Nanopelagicales bacterium]|nr:hypothetical protein [Candidatus Nanopelagicales bacterium]